MSVTMIEDNDDVDDSWCEWEVRANEKRRRRRRTRLSSIHLNRFHSVHARMKSEWERLRNWPRRKCSSMMLCFSFSMDVIFSYHRNTSNMIEQSEREAEINFIRIFILSDYSCISRLDDEEMVYICRVNEKTKVAIWENICRPVINSFHCLSDPSMCSSSSLFFSCFSPAIRHRKNRW